MGLGWNIDELLALARAVTKVCEDPAVGNQMSIRRME